MHIRRQLITALALSPLFWQATAHAGLLDAISSKDASSGLRQALEQGATLAVSGLGANDGFFGNERFRIPLPDTLQKAEKILRGMGQGAALDELHLKLNRAAESAVSEAKPLLLNAVKGMSVQDAKGILTGGEDSVTQFFRSKTSSALGDKFLPLVTQVTSKLQLAGQYNQIVGKAAAFGLVKEEDAKLEPYITKKALEALYLRISDEEKNIRQNPAQAVGSLAKKVFGALGK